MKICAGTIICSSTKEKQKSLPLKCRRPNAYPAIVAVNTAQSTRKKIINSVFLYNTKKFMLRMTSLNESVLHTFGKITNGSTLVASVTVLNAVKIIHIKGTSIVMDTSSLLLSCYLPYCFPLPSYRIPIFSVQSSGLQ